jgi:predicted phage terminase large subunit-like protein
MGGDVAETPDGEASDAKCLSYSDLILPARVDFWIFVELVFGILHPGQQLVFAPYLEVLAEVLMGAACGRFRRLIFNLPPRHMKSMMVSVLWVAWRLGQNPSAKFICISYGDDLAHDLSARVRTLMLSPLYARIFPKTILDKKAVHHITTTLGGARYATAVGSDITGFGADVIIIDDPMQPEAATSPSAKERVFSWLQSSVLTRFNDQTRGVLILVMHRLAPDDLSATLEATGCYRVFKLPLVAEEKLTFTGRHERVLMQREPGEVLNPDRLNAHQLAQLKADLAPHVFAAQCQQRPAVGGSGMLPVENFGRYDRKRPPNFEFMVHSWDVGATVTGNASVCTKWGIFREGEQQLDKVYLTEVIRLKVQLPEVRAAIKAQDKADRPALIIIDERGVGLGIYQDLRAAGMTHVTKSTATHEPWRTGDGTGSSGPNQSKIERFGRAVMAVADERVFVPTEAPWLEAFLFEIAAFPNIADKDQVDSFSQFVANLGPAMMRARQSMRRRQVSSCTDPLPFGGRRRG